MFHDNVRGYESQGQLWLRAARLQLRVISALVRRETRAHFGEHRLGYLWALIEPSLHLLGFIVLFGYILVRHVPVGGSLTLFIVTGVLPYFLYSKLATYLSSAIASNKALLNLPPVKPMDVLIARAILEALTYLLVGAILLLALYLIKGDRHVIPSDPLSLAAAIVVLVTFGFGVGAINATLQSLMTNWSTLFSLVTGPLYLLSAVWFLPAEVPPPLRGYLLYNPILHLVLWFRSGFYPPYVTQFLDRGYAIWWAVSALTLGLILQRVMRRKILEPT